MITLLQGAWHELKACWKNHEHNRQVRAYCTDLLLQVQKIDLSMKGRALDYVEAVCHMCLMYSVVLSPMKAYMLEGVGILEWETDRGTFTISLSPRGGDTWRQTSDLSNRLLARSGPMEATYPYKVLLRLHR